MSTDRISIFNYEAFYLDHLEGNLGEEDTALLLAFLEEHPELIEEEEDFVLLDPTADTPVFDDKDSLKIVSDEAAIALSNVEHFLIAESEGQLPATKQQELNAFVVQHPHLEKERKYLAAMFLKADQSIVYANKSGLKRKGAIIFWPYVGLAAASVLIAFLFLMNNGSEQEQFAEKDPVEKNDELKNESPVIEQDDIQIANNVEGTQETQSVEQSDDRNIGISEKSPKIQHRQRQTRSESNNPLIQQKQPTIASVNSIKYKRPRKVINSIDSKDLQPVSPKMEMPELTTLPENDYAQTSSDSDRMKNPIKPITSRLEKTLKTDVDFKTGKAANNTGAGFFLKIGKFEISRKKGKRKKN